MLLIDRILVSLRGFLYFSSLLTPINHLVSSIVTIIEKQNSNFVSAELHRLDYHRRHCHHHLHHHLHLYNPTSTSGHAAEDHGVPEYSEWRLQIPEAYKMTHRVGLET